MKALALNCKPETIDLLQQLSSASTGEWSVEAQALSEGKSYVPNADAIFLFWEGEAEQGVQSLSQICHLRKTPEIPLILLSPQAEEIQSKATGYAAFHAIPTPINLESLQGVLEGQAPKRSSSPQILIKQLIQASTTILSSMCEVTSVQKKELFVNEDTQLFGEISGIMGLSGKLTGSMVLSFQTEMAKKLTAKMLDCEASELSAADLEDAVGELTNMISGEAKKLLINTDYAFSISLPTVVSGKNQQVGWNQGTKRIGITLSVDGEDFVIYLVLSQE